MADASDQAVGAVLQQLVNGTWESLAFLARGCVHRRSTVLLTENCSPFTWAYNTSTIFWRGDNSSPTLTINPSASSVCHKYPSLGQITSNVNSHTSPNSQQTFDICRGKTSLSLTRCPEPPSMTCSWVSTTPTWLWPSNKTLMYRLTSLPTRPSAKNHPLWNARCHSPL